MNTGPPGLETVLLIQTGGTIDKEFAESGNDATFAISDPAAMQILRGALLSYSVQMITGELHSPRTAEQPLLQFAGRTARRSQPATVRRSWSE